MIQKTLLEWSSLAYGEDDNQIPEWAADRIATVARSSPLGGEGGARILNHGRNALRAAQVVGVIAAEGCSLEILPKIDFPGSGENASSIGQTRKQLVHMLAVALNLKIDSGAITDLGWQRENLLEILIRIFVSKLSDEVRRGMPRQYVGHEDDLPVLRGRLDVNLQFTALAVNADRLACRYDDLSPDIALNQIMKATIIRLSAISRSNENQRRLRELSLAYADISQISVAELAWQRVVLDRTNARWQELLNIAKLILGERFQTTSAGSGRGFSLLFEMNTLFEEFVSRILKRTFAGTSYRVHSQGGRLYCLEDLDTRKQRFMTKPDLLLKRGGEVELIIDTKWKRLSRAIDDPKQGVSQADVYQMMAYGRIYGTDRLMLLYPHHVGLDDHEGITGCHRIQGTGDLLATATVDVSFIEGMPQRLKALAESFVVPDSVEVSSKAAIGA